METPHSVSNQKLYILPCLHERIKRGSILWDENIPSRPQINERGGIDSCVSWKNVKALIMPSRKGICNTDQPTTAQDVRCTWNYLVEFLSDTRQGGTTPSYRKCDHIELTESLQNCLFNKFPPIGDTIPVFIIVGHHHKLAQLFYREDGHKVNIANTGCIRMVLTGPNTIMTTVFQTGFPDKSEYNYVTEGSTIGPSRYLTNCLRSYMTLGGSAVIYWVRHGNSIHNSPLKQKRIDSCLTPLGIYQAKCLGKHIAADIEGPLQYFRRPMTIRYVASHMNRTQHTCLAIRDSVNNITSMGDFMTWATSLYQNSFSSNPSLSLQSLGDLNQLYIMFNKLALHKLDRCYKHVHEESTSKQRQKCYIYWKDEVLKPHHRTILEKLQTHQLQFIPTGLYGLQCLGI